MQLVAYGAQDVYLTGNPQITFFKVVYRRHTNFSKECIEQTFSGAVDAGKRISATLARNGDLVQEVYLKVDVSTAVTVADTTADDKTLGGDLTRLISMAEVEVGGQKIDRQYGAWMDIYNSLFETNHDYRLAMSTGHVVDQGDANSVAGQTTTSTVFLPLRFWFNRNPGLALPLIALQYHEVKVNIELADFDAAVAQGGGCVVTRTLDEATLLVNYLYLDTDERRRFAQVSHEYLIEQVQHTGAEVVDKGKITLNFNHPVKCLAWSSWDPLVDAKLQLNGHDRAAKQLASYYQLVQPYESGLGHSKALLVTTGTGATDWGVPGAATNNVYLYSFALKPGEHQPSGTCNFSRIDNAVLQVNHGGSATTNQVSVFAVNYNVLRVMSGMGGLAYSN
jgi:hypothetical protein